jgi:signal transduction histidine kinase
MTRRLFNSLQFQLYTSLAVLVVLLTLTSVFGVVLGKDRIQRQLAAQLTLQQELKLYQMSDLTRSYAETTSQTERQSLVESFRKIALDFATTQSIFRTGDKSLGLSSVQDQGALSVLSDLDQGWETYDKSVEKHLTADATISLDAIKQQWQQVIIFNQNLRQVFQDLAVKAQEFSSSANGWMGLLSTVFVFVPILITVRAIRAIWRLRKVTEALGAGDLNARANEKSLTELSDLGRTFNVMATSVQQRQTELRQLNETLEKRVEERTQELRHATNVAREMSRLKSEFLANMSHELRTPLNAISGFTSIMLEGMSGEIDDEARHMLQRVYSNGQHLLTLINQILDLAKIEAGRIEIVSKPFALRPLVEQWQSQINVLAQQKKLAFEVHIDPALPPMLSGDAPRITQIAFNLLSNAIKFTEKGTVTLDVRRQVDTWQIQVSDTGVGIPPHALNYIFEEFRQVDGSSTREKGGTGLGLSIARNLARMMNGDILVTSELGQGSIFTITLPLVELPQAETAQLQVAAA